MQLVAGGNFNSSTLEVKKANSSFLFNGSWRKSIQLPGSFVLPETFLCTPLPLYSRVDSFKLSDMYVSLTTSNLVAVCSCFSRYGMNTMSAYSWKVLTLVVGRKWAMTAPSMTLQSQVEGGSDCPGCSRHCSRPYFVFGK